MITDTELFFMQDFVADILNEIEKAKKQEENPEFAAGLIAAYYDVLLTLQDEYRARAVDLEKIGLDIDLDELCFGQSTEEK